MFKIQLTTLLLLAMTLASGCNGSSKNSPKSSSSSPVLIGEYFAANDSYAKLSEALEVTQLSALVYEEGNIIVFAPNNEAFAKIDPLTLELLFAQAEASPEGDGTLKNILKYHIIQGLEGDLVLLKSKIGSNENNAYSTEATLLGPNLEITGSGEGMLIQSTNSESKILEADILATNGVIQSIDTLLNPTETVFPGSATIEIEQAEPAQPKESTEGVNSILEEGADKVEEGGEKVQQNIEESTDKVEAEAKRVASDVEDVTKKALKDIKDVF